MWASDLGLTLLRTVSQSIHVPMWYIYLNYTANRPGRFKDTWPNLVMAKWRNSVNCGVIDHWIYWVNFEEYSTHPKSIVSLWTACVLSPLLLLVRGRSRGPSPENSVVTLLLALPGRLVILLSLTTMRWCDDLSSYLMLLVKMPSHNIDEYVTLTIYICGTVILWGSTWTFQHCYGGIMSNGEV